MVAPLSTPWRRLAAWLVPMAPPALRAEVERRQLTLIRAHLPLVYLTGAVNALIVMAVCARADIPLRYYLWMAGLVLLSVGRTLWWRRHGRDDLPPGQVTSLLASSARVAVLAMLVMGTFSAVTFVTGAFHRSLLIPVSLAFGSMAFAQSFAPLRPAAVAGLTLGIVPSALALLAVGDFEARVLGFSLLTVAVFMVHFVAAQFDHLVTEVKLRRDIHELAHTDALTHLPNRRAMVELLEQELAKGPGHAFAVALLDLDGFKGVNDRLGHLAGDALLRVVAQRLTSTCGDTDTAGRLGGDEFLVLLREQGGALDVEARVQALLAALCQPTELAGEVVPVRSSLGYARFPHEGRTTPELLAAADAALYAQKHHRAGAPEAGAGEPSGERRRHRGP